MSFFDDFLKNFNIEDVKNELNISMIINHGVLVVGSVKVKSFSEEEIVLIYKKREYKVIGKRLKIKSMSKGEVFVEGGVIGFVGSV